MIAGRGRGSGSAATIENLLYGGTGVTGPLVLFSLVPHFMFSRARVLALSYQDIVGFPTRPPVSKELL